MPAGDLLGNGVSGLLAFQRALSTTGHNIANVNTAGYSRQTVDFSTRIPTPVGNGFIGNGVEVGAVKRVYDSFLVGQLRSSTSAASQFSTYYSFASRVDNILADPQVGLTPAMQSFFDAVQGVSDDPTSASARQVLLTEAESMTSRFSYLDNQMDGLRGSVNTQIRDVVSQVNSLADSLASINKDIVFASARAGGQPPNDLLDARDAMVEQLSQLVSVSTVAQDDGALNVFIGTGQALVLDNAAFKLEVTPLPQDISQLEISYRTGSDLVPVSDFLTGGQIGGLLQFRDEVLDPAQNALGRVAIGLGTFFNEQHRRGMDLDGDLGQDFFSVASPQVLPDPNNSGSITVTFDNVSQVTTEDYSLAFDGGSWTLRRQSDQQVVPMTGTGTAADPFLVDGLSIVVGAGAVNGDNYLIRPTRQGASGMNVLIDNSRDVAAAAPIRTDAAATNTGTGTLSAGTVTDIDNAAFQTTPGALTPPILIRFTTATTYDVLDAGTLAVLDSGTYDPATGEDLFPTENLALDYGYRARLTGNPAAGDEFSIGYNTGGVGDNRNALLLGDLQNQMLLAGNTASFVGAYGQLVADVGTNTKQAEINNTAQGRLLEQAQGQRDSVSGVNLDEEAADLVRFQQAYQAAAQVVAAADDMFQTLLNAVS